MNRVRAYVGVGSNLLDPERQVLLAIRALDGLAATRVVRCSSLYRTAPVGTVAQPDFINAVCELETGLEPEQLLSALLDLERAQGRVRGAERGGPRTLDLDLLLYDEARRADARLQLPHPRLHERAFVLYPLSEIAPALDVPGRGPLAELLPACQDQRVTRLPRSATFGG